MFAVIGNFQNLTMAPIQVTGTGVKKGFLESVSESWDAQMFSGNSTSKQNNLHDGFADYIQEIKETTGEDLELYNPYMSGWEKFAVEDIIGHGISMLGFGDPVERYKKREADMAARNQEFVSRFYKKVDKLREKYPDMPYKSFDDIQQGILKKAEALRQRSEDGRLDNHLGAFVGTAAAAMTDPVNVTATLLTGGWAAGTSKTLLGALGRTALIEGTVNMAAEAAIQPDVYQYHQELGDDYTAGDAAAAVAMAGAAGGLISAAAKAGGGIFKKLLSRYHELKAKGVKFKPLEEDAAALAAQKVELDDFVARTNPFGDSEIADIFNTEALLKEQRQLSGAYDLVAKEPHGPVDDPLIRIQPEDMEGVVIERGEWKPISGGNAKAGYGLVKFIWKHGPLGKDEIPIMKDDVVSFPRIMREYEALTLDRYGDNRMWSVKRADGVQIIYADKRLADGEKHMVTIHAVNPARPVRHELTDVYSPKKKHPVPDVSFQDPRQDTAQGTFGRPLREDAVPENISPEMQDVNIADKPAYPTAQDLQKVLEAEDVRIPGAEIDGQVEMVSAREVLEKIKQEDSWIDEIASCIAEFGKR